MTVGFDAINRKRAASVYKTYSEESNAYIDKNRAGLEQIFADMQSTSCAFSPCGSIKQEDIMNLISDDLKDFSSTGFVAINKSNELMFMRLSGERDLFYTGDWGASKLKELIKGTRSELPWEEYTYFFEGKEIVVPFRDSQGKITGLLVRGVIEK